MHQEPTFYIHATYDDFISVCNSRNYFWSDSRSEGFGFELSVVAPGDKFTVIDAHHKSVGHCEIICNKVNSPVLTFWGIASRYKKLCGR